MILLTKITPYNASMATLAVDTEHPDLDVAIVRENQNQVYFWGDLIVAPNLTDKMLAYTYLEWERQGLNEYIWYEGVPTLTWFLDHFMKMTVLGCFKDVAGVPQIVGIGWFNSLTIMGGTYKKAEAGMAFFKQVLPEETKRYGQLMIDWVFKHLGLDAMHGATPVKNRAAMHYMKSLDFEHCGPVGGYCSYNGELCACEISWMMRDRWDRIKPFRVEKVVTDGRT